MERASTPITFPQWTEADEKHDELQGRFDTQYGQSLSAVRNEIVSVVVRSADLGGVGDGCVEV